MKILEELRLARGFKTLLVTTYAVDLPWFEALLLRQLQLRGIKQFILLVDPNQLSQNLGACGHLLRAAGRSYTIHPVRGVLSFHPKLLLLAGDHRFRLYVGSGNLTRGGMDANREVFDRWDASDTDQVISPAFTAASSYLQALTARFLDSAPRLVSAGIQDVVSGLASLHPSSANEDLEFWHSPGSLLEHLPTPETSADNLQIVAPFFDPAGKFATELATKMRADRFEVITDVRRSNLTQDAAKAIREVGGRLFTLDQEVETRPLHAKLFTARGRGWALGITGSANASTAAWQGHNAELVVARRGAAAAVVEDLISQLRIREIRDDEWGKLPTAAAVTQAHLEEVASAPAPALEISHVQWAGLRRVRLCLTSSATNPETVEFLTTAGVAFSHLAPNTAPPSEFFVDVPDHVQRGRVTIVRLRVGNDAGQWVVVLDPEEIQQYLFGGSEARQRLEDLLGRDDFDPQGATELLRVFASVARARHNSDQRARAAAPGDQASVAGEGGSAPDQPEIRLIGLDDFVEQGEQTPRSLKEQSYLGATLSIRLMNRLLFRDEIDGEADSDEGESEAVDEGREPSEGSSKDQESRTPAPTRTKLDFLAAAEDARNSYMRTLPLFAQRGPYRLLDDLQILAAPLHYMLAAGNLTSWQFVNQMVSLLRALIGHPSAPLISAVCSLDVEDREDFLRRSPSSLLLHLLLYNTCLVDFDLDASLVSDAGFPNRQPVLWARHWLRLLPEASVGQLSKECEARASQLRLGIFWIADRYAGSAARIPFPDFVHAMVRDSQALDALEGWLRSQPSSLQQQQPSDDENEPLVVLSRPGLLGAGWQENRRVIFRDGAFQGPERRGYLETMKITEVQNGVPARALKEMADCSALEVKHALDLLYRFA